MFTFPGIVFQRLKEGKGIFKVSPIALRRSYLIAAVTCEVVSLSLFAATWHWISWRQIANQSRYSTFSNSQIQMVCSCIHEFRWAKSALVAPVCGLSVT